MTPTLAVCLLLQWILILGLVAVVLAMARQIGILYERIAPMGALMMDPGPKVGDPAPQFRLSALDGQNVSIGYTGEKSILLFFLSPTCPVCKKLLPILRSLGKAEQSWMRIVFASDGEVAAHTAFALGPAIDGSPYVLSAELGRRFQVGKLPHAVLIDGSGRIRSKGLVNSREQLESLITASELGVASVQEFIENRHKSTDGPTVRRSA
jgi:methylamine dehydrogenase accessory protein MauD